MLERESELENQIGKYFLEMGFFCQKFPKLKTFGNRRMTSPLSLNGSPDLYIVEQGRFFAIEIKKPGCKQSEAQKEFERRLRAAGSNYFIAYSLDDAANIVAAIEALDLF